MFPLITGRNLLSGSYRTAFYWVQLRVEPEPPSDWGELVWFCLCRTGPDRSLEPEHISVWTLNKQQHSKVLIRSRFFPLIRFLPLSVLGVLVLQVFQTILLDFG